MPAKRKAFLFILSIVFITLAPLAIRSGLPPAGDWEACCITTAAGEILVHVYPGQAPLTAANFLRYVAAGLYDGTSFFRVVTPDNQPGDKVRIEVIQGGDVAGEKCFPAIAHETTAMTGLKHGDGVISMARAEPGTATSSFFICVNDQPELDFGGRRNPDGQGFAAFGRVVKGMDVVRRIQRLEQERQILKQPVPITSCIRLPKPSGLPGATGRGLLRTGGIPDIVEQLRSSLRRMTLKHFIVLLLVLGLLGWLGWRGILRSKYARGESPAWEGSSWAVGDETPPWLHALALAILLLVAALFAILLIDL